MGLDNIILFLGKVEDLNKQAGREFVAVGNRVERKYVCRSYEDARKKFRRSLAQSRYAGVVFYDFNIDLEKKEYYFKGYPIREKNKNSRQ